jgi:hypothetical protein
MPSPDDLVRLPIEMLSVVPCDSFILQLNLILTSVATRGFGALKAILVE